MKRLGIIGGMGPEATADLFKKIIDRTPASCDQEHIPIVIDNYPQIPDRTLYLKGEGQSPLPFLFESIERLERTGVDCLCMPCNTAHYFIKELREKASVPFISMIEAVVKEIKSMEKEPVKIGLLATDGAMIGKVYHNAFESAGMKIADFDKETQQLAMNAIYTLKSGDKKKAFEILNIAMKKIEKERYDVVIAGCTEIPVLLPYIEKIDNLRILDATLALADSIVDYCFP